MSTGLKTEQQILAALADGPKHKTDLRRALGWSVVARHKGLEVTLQRMRIAGLIETAPDGRQWQLRAGTEVCPACAGRGIRKTAAE